jgi:hypothetical protein
MENRSIFSRVYAPDDTTNHHANQPKTASILSANKTDIFGEVRHELSTNRPAGAHGPKPSFLREHTEHGRSAASMIASASSPHLLDSQVLSERLLNLRKERRKIEAALAALGLHSTTYIEKEISSSATTTQANHGTQDTDTSLFVRSHGLKGHAKTRATIDAGTFVYVCINTHIMTIT